MKYLSQTASSLKTTTKSEPTATKEVSKANVEEKTIISEADSTEPSKKSTSVDFSEDIDMNEVTKSKGKESPSTLEGPPGVSPRESPKAQPISSNLPSRHQASGKHKITYKCGCY